MWRHSINGIRMINLTGVFVKRFSHYAVAQSTHCHGVRVKATISLVSPEAMAVGNVRVNLRTYLSSWQRAGTYLILNQAIQKNFRKCSPRMFFIPTVCVEVLSTFVCVFARRKNNATRNIRYKKKKKIFPNSKFRSPILDTPDMPIYCGMLLGLF